MIDWLRLFLTCDGHTAFKGTSQIQFMTNIFVIIRMRSQFTRVLRIYWLQFSKSDIFIGQTQIVHRGHALAFPCPLPLAVAATANSAARPVCQPNQQKDWPQGGSGFKADMGQGSFFSKKSLYYFFKIGSLIVVQK